MKSKVKIRLDLILSKYPSLESLAKDIGVTKKSIYDIKYKTTGIFREGSKSYKTFRKLEQMGYVEREFTNQEEKESA